MTEDMTIAKDTFLSELSYKKAYNFITVVEKQFFTALEIIIFTIVNIKLFSRCLKQRLCLTWPCETKHPGVKGRANSGDNMVGLVIRSQLFSLRTRNSAV